MKDADKNSRPPKSEQMVSSKQRATLTVAIGIMAAAIGVNTVALLRTHSVLLARSNLVVAVALLTASVALIVLVRRAAEFEI